MLLLLGQSWTTIQLMQHLPAAIFVFCVGAAVGSFVNVVNYRLPSGMSVITPPSRCPTCGARLRFFRENLPILGWFFVRGRCRYCRARISPEYMLVELAMALLFVGLYLALFTVHPTTPFLGGIGNGWWYGNQFVRAWPAFFVLAFLLAGLVSMTMIDARTFLIPIQIPLFVTIVAFVLYPLQSVLPMRHRPTWPDWPIPGVSWTTTAAAFCGLAGIAVGMVLLKTGRVRYSFADYHEYVQDDEVLGEYPHARREMFVELLFLAPCLIGLAAGVAAGRWLPEGGPPAFVQAIAASAAGYLVGAGFIWGVRILGSLGFGREAMGLGDVHLLGAVGAVLGWFDPILVFFIAPFSGLLWFVLSMGLKRMFTGLRRELPYGPHLAFATFIVVLARPGAHWLWTEMLSLPWPAPGFI